MGKQYLKPIPNRAAYKMSLSGSVDERKELQMYDDIYNQSRKMLEDMKNKNIEEDELDE